MHVSAQARYLDYSTRPLYAKNKRRPDDDDTLPARKVEPRSEEDRPEEDGQPAPGGGFDDDETLEYSRQVPASAAAETGRPTVRAAPSVQATALWALLGSAKAETAAPAGAPAPKAPAQADAFYDLLDQVIAQA